MGLALVAIVLFALLMFTRRRLEAVEAKARQLSDLVELLQQRIQRLESGVGPQPEPEPEPPARLEPELAHVARHVPEPEPALSPPPGEPPPIPLQPSAATPPPTAKTLLDQARELLFGGNTLVRAGIFILLIGVVLLLRYAAEHALLPIELRLTGAALLAIALVVVGYRQRIARPGFSRALQGGGVAGLYLVVFFAFRTYALLPGALAFGLLAGIALGSGALAVLQSSRSLILIAQLFGFAAPLLASTGQGSHVGLFSYYLLLNLVVAGVAWFKAWRALNLLGFAFTFGVASVWGVLRYEPRHFASTEPFLVAFFLVYVAIPVFYALRHPRTGHSFVDGSLVFGTPLAVLGLQWSMVRDRPFAMAYTALAMGAVYLGLAWLLKRRAPEKLTALGEAFLPIGVGFATLAIPYGLGNHNLTGAAWALEGGGLYWIGVRQARWLSRAAGFALQFLAGVALFTDPVREPRALPIFSTWFLAGTLVALSSLFVAYYSYANRARLEREWRLIQLAIGWALFFLVSMPLDEVETWVPKDLQPGAQIAWVGALALALELAAGKLAWEPARYPAIALWPAMFAFLVRDGASPLAHGGYFGWPVYAVAMLALLRRFAPGVPHLGTVLHPLALWLWCAWCAAVANHAVREQAGLDASYAAAATLATVTTILLVVLKLAEGSSWPFAIERRAYVRYGAAGIAVALMLYMFGANLSLTGSRSPIVYLPVLNALELALLMAAVSIWLWLRRGTDVVPGNVRTGVAIALAGLAFLVWNGVLARSVHHFAGVPFRHSELWESIALQVAFSLSWAVIALGLMIGAHRRRVRPAWWTGAGLLAVVVAKLFLLDLAELSAPAKIGTFLGVGLLLLVIGALAPVPPSATAPGERQPETPA